MNTSPSSAWRARVEVDFWLLNNHELFSVCEGVD